MTTILVVDDDADTRELLTWTLQGDGHEMVLCASGEDALEHLATNEPDVLVLDLMMPEMDGFEVLRRMKSLPTSQSVKILVLTGRRLESDWLQSYELGAHEYLAKPFGIQDLQDTFNNLVSMSKEELEAHRQEELAKAQLLTRLETAFDDL